MRNDPHVLSIVLAGGAGNRLQPLTADRAKPAVPFGGSYRLIDFVLSNLVNAGYTRVCVLTQYKSHSLDQYVTTNWQMSSMLGDYITPVPAQQRLGPRWFTGSADAIFQSLNLVYDEMPDIVCVFGADNVYRMDPRQMVAQHVESGAGVTVAGIRVPREEATEFGCIETESDGMTIKQFLEKPENPPSITDSPNESYVSMGNYVFTTEALLEALQRDADDEGSQHDMGGNIIPMLTSEGRASVYDFSKNVVPGETERDHAYWRDVGTLDAFYEAHMDLVSVHPVFNLYNRQWPIMGPRNSLPPAKFVEGGQSHDSMIGPGTVVAGAEVLRSVISDNVHIGSGSVVTNSVIMPGTRIGKNVTIQNAILDKYCQVADGATIGVDAESDKERFIVSDSGIVAVTKGAKVSALEPRNA